MCHITNLNSLKKKYSKNFSQPFQEYFLLIKNNYPTPWERVKEGGTP